jgi:hypothetical protein
MILTAFVLLAQSAFTAAPEHYTLEFENEYVRVVRVHYGPHETSSLHEHPANPTVYVYTTDGGEMLFVHEKTTITRKPVAAGAIRFSGGAIEKHTVTNLTGQASEYFRLELKTDPIDRPVRDVRLDPKGEFENGQIRIRRIACPARVDCAPMVVSWPAVAIDGASFRWVVPRNGPPHSGTDGALALTIVELKSKPVAAVPPPPAR